MRILVAVVVAAVGIGAAVIGAGQLGLLAGSAPAHLGVTNGRLSPPSADPNSVSSQAALYPDHSQRVYADVAPLAFTGDGEAAMARLANLLQQSPGTKLVKRQPDYIYAQCSTPLLKFTDDAEFWLDKTAGVIQVRSASRLGRKDFGVNRARIESIRARFKS